MTEKLKGLVVKGVQSHEHTKIVFSPHMTVIRGGNTVGKTALIRAIQSVTEMSPMFLRAGESKAVVRLIFGDVTVTRSREETEGGQLKSQKIVVRTQEGEKTYKKLGNSGLPQPLDEIIRMSPIRIDRTSLSLNVVRQDDPPFLISPVYKGSLRLKVLGVINDLHLFDVSLRLTKQRARDVQSQIPYVQRKLEEEKTKLEAIQQEPDFTAYYDRSRLLLEKIDDLYVKKRSALQRSEQIRESRQNVERCKTELDRLPKEPVLAKIEDLVVKHQDLQAQRQRLSSLIRQVTSLRKEIKDISRRGKALPSITQAQRLFHELTDLHQRKQSIESARQEIRELRVIIQKQQNRLSSLDQERDELRAQLQDLVENQNLCPYFPDGEVEFVKACKDTALKV